MRLKQFSFLKKTFLILITSGILLLAGLSFSLSQNPFKSIRVEEKKTYTNQLSVLSGMIYRHLMGYNLVCSTAGMPLKKYPDYFGQKYKNEMILINKEWQKYNTSLTEVLIRFDLEIYPSIANDIQKELIDLERMVAQNMLAHQNNISVDQLHWNAELENQMNLKDACILLDDGARFLLDQSSFDSEFKRRLKNM